MNILKLKSWSETMKTGAVILAFFFSAGILFGIGMHMDAVRDAAEKQWFEAATISLDTEVVTTRLTSYVITVRATHQGITKESSFDDIRALRLLDKALADIKKQGEIISFSFMQKDGKNAALFVHITALPSSR